jgi:hypothetical protein
MPSSSSMIRIFCIVFPNRSFGQLYYKAAAFLHLPDRVSIGAFQGDTAAENPDDPPYQMQASQNLENLRLELTSLHAELDATPLWRPDLNLSGSMGLPDLSDYSIGASISFSPGDIKDEEREDLEEAIDEKLVDIQIEQFDHSLQKRLVEQNISIVEQARLSLESAEIDSFAAAADLYKAQSELLMLYVLASED